MFTSPVSCYVTHFFFFFFSWSILFSFLRLSSLPSIEGRCIFFSEIEPYTERPKMYRKSVLHMLKYIANLYLSRYSADFQ